MMNFKDKHFNPSTTPFKEWYLSQRVVAYCKANNLKHLFDGNRIFVSTRDNLNGCIIFIITDYFIINNHRNDELKGKQDTLTFDVELLLESLHY